MKEVNKLHSLRIGARCFSSTERGEAASLSNVFSLSLCPTLQVLVIGNFSFSNFGVFTLSDLPSLAIVQIGTPGQESYCFAHASLLIRSILELSIWQVDLGKLEKMVIGDYAFSCSESMVIESILWTVNSQSDCSSLTTIQLGRNALQGKPSSTVSAILSGMSVPLHSPQIFLPFIRSMVKEATSITLRPVNWRVEMLFTLYCRPPKCQWHQSY